MTVHGGEAVGLLAAILWGASDFCGGFVTRRSSPSVVVMIAHGSSLVILLLLQLALHASAPSWSTAGYGLLAGLAGGIGLMALYKGLSLGAMGLVAAVSGVITAIVPVLVALFTQGMPSIVQLLGFAVALPAIWLIAYTPGNKPHPQGLGMAVLAGICFGFLLVFLNISGKGGVLWAMAFSRIASSSCAAVSFLATLLRPRQESTLPKAGWWIAVFPLALVAGLLDTSGNLLYTVSSLVGRLDVAAVLSSLYPAGTILLAIWLLKERATRAQTIGMVLALVAVVLISV